MTGWSYFWKRDYYILLNRSLTSLAWSAPGSCPYRGQDFRRGYQWRQKLIWRLSFVAHRGLLVSNRPPFPHIGSLLFRSSFFRRTIPRVVMWLFNWRGSNLTSKREETGRTYHGMWHLLLYTGKSARSWQPWEKRPLQLRTYISTFQH